MSAPPPQKKNTLELIGTLDGKSTNHEVPVGTFFLSMKYLGQVPICVVRHHYAERGLK